MELKPCPFCGENDVEVIHTVMGNYYYVICRDCGAAGPIQYSSAAAIHIWNRRAA